MSDQIPISASKDAGRWLLAIDTSTEQAGLALTDGSAFSELSWRSGRDQTVSVLAQIDHLLQLQGVGVADLSGVAVATGPGMFNGLRVGMSIAKGLHLGSGMPLLGVSTLEMTAHPHFGFERSVIAVVAAGRGRLVWQPFPVDGAPQNGTAQELAIALSSSSGAIVVGEFGETEAELFGAVSNAVVPPFSARMRRPSVLAEIGWDRLVAGNVDDPISLSPAYIHTARVMS